MKEMQMKDQELSTSTIEDFVDDLNVNTPEGFEQFLTNIHDFIVKNVKSDVFMICEFDNSTSKHPNGTTTAMLSHIPSHKIYKLFNYVINTQKALKNILHDITKGDINES